MITLTMAGASIRKPTPARLSRLEIIASFRAAGVPSAQAARHIANFYLFAVLNDVT